MLNILVAAATETAAPDTFGGLTVSEIFARRGEAYFRDALARTRSFTQAFELARSAVAKREAQEKLTASLPQMWVGRALGARLQQPADQPDK